MSPAYIGLTSNNDYICHTLGCIKNPAAPPRDLGIPLLTYSPRVDPEPYRTQMLVADASAHIFENSEGSWAPLNPDVCLKRRCGMTHWD